MTPEMVVAIGRAIAAFFKTDTSVRVVIGKDTRISGDMLECALAAGLCSMGADACLCGVLPPRELPPLQPSWSMCRHCCLCSHNPYADNGIKVFDVNGFKLSESVEQELEKRILKERHGSPSPVVGRCDAIMDAWTIMEIFCDAVPDLSLDGLRIVLDCSHGAHFSAPDVFSRMGAEIFVLSINRTVSTSMPVRLSAS